MPTSDWLTSLSSDWLTLKTLSWQKNFTAYVCVVASGGQRHPATAHVASHKVFVLNIPEKAEASPEMLIVEPGSICLGKAQMVLQGKGRQTGAFLTHEKRDAVESRQ